MFAKAIEKAIEGHSLIKTTKLKIGKPWAKARAFGHFLLRSARRLERLAERCGPADLGKALAETKALRAGLVSIATSTFPVPALVRVEAPLHVLSERVAHFVVNRGEELLSLIADATEGQLRRFALAVGSYRRKARNIEAVVSPAQGAIASIASQIDALDAMIVTVGSFAEARVGALPLQGRGR